MNHLIVRTACLLVLVSLPLVAHAAPAQCDYDVRVDAEPGLVLHVEGRCRGIATGSLRFAHLGSSSFADVAAVAPGGVRYRFDLDRFVESSGNYRIATRRGDARMLTLSSWLAVPATASPDTRVRLRVDAGDAGFAAALPSDGEWRLIEIRNLRRAGYTLFGEFSTRVIQLPATGDAESSMIEVVDLRGGGDDVLPWIRDTALQVSRYYGGFPVPRLLLALLGTGGRGIDYGRVVSGGGATMLLVIGNAATVESLYGEWVLVHELLHLGAPFMPDGFWFMEGFATYAEPIIRARAGWRSERSVWNEFYRDMPRGMPALTDGGLARTRSGMYWGGALFMLLADIGFRRATDGERGIDHCMRQVLERLGNSTMDVPVMRVVEQCDASVGVPVMRALADRHVDSGSGLDLDTVWRDLGLAGPRGDVRIDDSAPDAAIRAAIVRRGADGEMSMDDDAPDVFR